MSSSRSSLWKAILSPLKKRQQQPVPVSLHLRRAQSSHRAAQTRTFLHHLHQAKRNPWDLPSCLAQVLSSVAVALDRLASLPGASIEHGDRLAAALDWAKAGMDLADALHLAALPAGSAFVSFDRALVRRARALGLPAREP